MSAAEKHRVQQMSGIQQTRESRYILRTRIIIVVCMNGVMTNLLSRIYLRNVKQMFMHAHALKGIEVYIM